jgi:hypothetical protein
LKYIILFFHFVFFSTIAFSQKDSYWQQQVNYTIDVRLDEKQKTLDGFVSIEYFNFSPDTLNFIWFHLWQNAYKNDQSAFSEQLLENNRTDFYFSELEKKGFINQLDFKIDDQKTSFTNHPQHQDIIKLNLPKPIFPGQTIKIQTPFHVKLPYNFSRGGYMDSAFQITQWYPKPAVYDKYGWHEMPYLDQGEFYSEFGNFEVNISIQKDFKVAATGVLQNETTIGEIKTLQYKQDNIHDFAWFADKSFIVEHDTMELNKKKIDVYAYHYPRKIFTTLNTLDLIKNAIRTKSNWIGNYPYDIVSVVESIGDGGGGMEYPTITLIDQVNSKKSLDNLINHEVGHNWFYGILASNERDYPWMDEGMNSYYDKRYEQLYYPEVKNNAGRFLTNRIPKNIENTITEAVCKIKSDQPITTKSADFTELNYAMIAYIKAALWMQWLEESLGKTTFDEIMKAYFDKWKFKHPYPEDFKSIAESVSQKDLSIYFDVLNKKGSFYPKQNKSLKIAPFFSFKDADKKQLISILPIAGINKYDKLMPGLMIHNYNLPTSKIQFLLMPMVSLTSKKINGLSRISYDNYLTGNGEKIQLALTFEKFSNNKFTPEGSNTHFFTFEKFVPSIKYVFRKTHPRSKANAFIQWKSFFIKETILNFYRDTILDVDVITYPNRKRTLHQLQLVYQQNRKLYPYSWNINVETGDGFLKLGATGNYYFNYVKEGGLNIRFFAGKFLYTKSKTNLLQFQTERYHLNMSGANGYEDYTYSNYFAGRNEFEGFLNQQMMIKDGAFKIRTDLLSSKIGKTDDWLTAININTSIPKKINPLELLPIKIPLKLFADIGTYGVAWQKKPPTEKILFNAGIQFSLFKEIVQIYLPLVYSKSFKDYVNSTIPEKKLLKTISFSIDIQKISFKTFSSFPQIPF